MHRPLGRATLLVYSPFASAWASAHCHARLAARFHKQSCRAGFGTRRAFAFRTPSLQNHRLWCNRSVIIPFLRHPLSSGFLGKTNFFIIGKYFFDGGGEI